MPVKCELARIRCLTYMERCDSRSEQVAPAKGGKAAKPGKGDKSTRGKGEERPAMGSDTLADVEDYDLSSMDWDDT